MSPISNSHLSLPRSYLKLTQQKCSHNRSICSRRSIKNTLFWPSDPSAVLSAPCSSRCSFAQHKRQPRASNSSYFLCRPFDLLVLSVASLGGDRGSGVNGAAAGETHTTPPGNRSLSRPPRWPRWPIEAAPPTAPPPSSRRCSSPWSPSPWFALLPIRRRSSPDRITEPSLLPGTTSSGFWSTGWQRITGPTLLRILDPGTGGGGSSEGTRRLRFLRILEFWRLGICIGLRWSKSSEGWGGWRMYTSIRVIRGVCSWTRVRKALTSMIRRSGLGRFSHRCLLKKERRWFIVRLAMLPLAGEESSWCR